MPQTEQSSIAREFATGWALLLAATIGFAVTGCHFHVTGAMMKPLGAAYGWSRGNIALAISISTIVTAMVHVPVGILLDKVGPRRVAIPGVILFGAGVALFGLAGSSLWIWSVAYSAFGAMLVPAAAFVWAAAVVVHFHAARALALSICLVGSAVLTSIMPSVILVLVARYGVSGAYFVMAVAAVLLMLPGALWALPKRKAIDPATAAAHGPANERDRAERREILQGDVFRRLLVVVALISMCIGTYSVHYLPMLTDAGLSPDGAARAALATGPAMIVSALAAGMLLDRIDPRFSAAVLFLIPAVTAATLFGYHGDALRGTMIAALVGATLGGPVTVVSFLASYYFAARHFGFVSGIFFGMLGIFIGLGSWLAGLMFDTAGSYVSTYTGLVVAGLLAALVMFTVKRPEAVLQPA